MRALIVVLALSQSLAAQPPDFGETSTLRALLAAGADRTMKNREGRNALEQAQYLKNGAIEAEIKRR